MAEANFRCDCHLKHSEILDDHKQDFKQNAEDHKDFQNNTIEFEYYFIPISLLFYYYELQNAEVDDLEDLVFFPFCVNLNFHIASATLLL